MRPHVWLRKSLRHHASAADGDCRGHHPDQAPPRRRAQFATATGGRRKAPSFRHPLCWGRSRRRPRRDPS